MPENKSRKHAFWHLQSLVPVFLLIVISICGGKCHISGLISTFLIRKCFFINFLFSEFAGKKENGHTPCCKTAFSFLLENFQNPLSEELICSFCCLTDWLHFSQNSYRKKSENKNYLSESIYHTVLSWFPLIYRKGWALQKKLII